MPRILIVLLALCLVLAACGGDDADEETVASAEDATTAPEPTEAPEATGPTETALPPAGDGFADGAPAGGDDDGAAAGGDDDGGGDTGDTGDTGAAGSSGDGEERGLSEEDQGADMVGDVGDDPVTGGDQSGGGVAQLTDVRVGEHEGFDRVVFEFAGASVPRYEVAYTDPPLRAAGSGREVEVEGDAFLQIRFSGASGVDLSGDQAVETYSGPQRIDGDGTMSVSEVVQLGDFEAQLTWVAGLNQQMPFSVGTLSDPARLVVDIQGM